MPELWFWFVAVMITVYVVLDGFDLGAGVLHLFVARNDGERQQVLGTIGPVWDGNEVWLLAGGGTLFFAFPGLYASSFSGFYLPLMVVLWLFMLRGMSIELRGHVDHPVWAPFWDVVFGGASLLLIIFFGAALGNVVRGVPVDASGNFFLPFWTTFSPASPDPGILDWFTILIAVFALSVLTMHGALWVRYKTSGDLNLRSGVAAQRAFIAAAICTVIASLVTFGVQPHIVESFSKYPAGYLFPLIAVLGFGGVWIFLRREGGELKAFLASCVYILGLMTSAVFGLFPFVLPNHADPRLGLTIYNTATADGTLKIGVVWWIPGMILAAIYSYVVYSKFAGKVLPPPITRAAAAADRF